MGPSGDAGRGGRPVTGAGVRGQGPGGALRPEAAPGDVRDAAGFGAGEQAIALAEDAGDRARRRRRQDGQDGDAACRNPTALAGAETRREDGVDGRERGGRRRVGRRDRAEHHRAASRLEVGRDEATLSKTLNKALNKALNKTLNKAGDGR